MFRQLSFLIVVMLLAGCGHPRLGVLQSRSDECFRAEDYQSALSFAQEAAQVAHETPNPEQEGLNLERVGRCYWKLKQLDKAVEPYDQAIKIWLATPASWIGMPRALNAKAGVLIDLKRYDEAEAALKQASRYSLGEGNKEPIYRERMKDFRNINYRLERLALVARMKGEDPTKWYEYGINEMNNLCVSHPSMRYTSNVHIAHLLALWRRELGNQPDQSRSKHYEEVLEKAKKIGVDPRGEGSEFPYPDPMVIPPVRSDAGA